MANFHRLIVCAALAFLSWLPASSFASFAIPTTYYWTSSNPVIGQYPDATSACTATVNALKSNWPTQTVTLDSITANGATEYFCNFRFHTDGQTDNVYAMANVQRQTQTVCPSGSTTAGGQCTCTAPKVQNATNDGCVDPPSPCLAGTPTTTTFDSGWTTPGDLAGAFSQYNAFNSAVACQAGFGPSGANACRVSYTLTNTGNGPNPREQSGSSGHSYYTFYLNGTTTGATCSTPTTATNTTPEPPCAGQQGMFNGVMTCLPVESQASIDRRAAAVAAAAASAARLAAINAGRTPDQADAAARAAGAAAAAASRSGSSPSEAAAAGAAAGSAAAASAAAGATSSTTMNEGTAAGAVQAAGDRARAIATAAGASAAVIAQAEASARAAAATTAASVLRNGGTVSQATEAARLAGQTATASVLAGSTGAEATERGVNDGIGDAVGSSNDTTTGTDGSNGNPSPQDPVGDFCAKNPQAKMCKTEEDSSFSGACGSPPACAGDAVLCAIAAATFASECHWNQPASAATAAYDAAAANTGKVTDNLPGNSSMSLGAGSFDTSDALGGGSCIADKSASIMGHSYVIPFSKVCPHLSLLGYVLMFVTFIIAARIVGRGK